MKLTWYGHACFKLETAEGSLVFDPYEKGYLPALSLPELSADAVICSHGHGDHNAAEAVTLTGTAPAFKVTQLPCFHDEVKGAKRGKNLITVIEAEGLRLAHCGDLGHKLSPEQIKALGKLDILLMPVGGVYTVDAQTAKEICSEIAPKTVVPMHYKMGSAGLQNVAERDAFLSLFDDGDVLYLGKNVWDIDGFFKPVTVFELC